MKSLIAARTGRTIVEGSAHVFSKRVRFRRTLSVRSALDSFRVLGNVKVALLLTLCFDVEEN